jgi:hypothetical protein
MVKYSSGVGGDTRRTYYICLYDARGKSLLNIPHSYFNSSNEIIELINTIKLKKPLVRIDDSLTNIVEGDYGAKVHDSFVVKYYKAKRVFNLIVLALFALFILLMLVIDYIF